MTGLAALWLPILLSAVIVFAMFFGVLFFFKEPRQEAGHQTASASETLGNFWKVLTNPKFMLFLLIFSGFWIVYWQEFITLPIYVHDYINDKADTERMLSTGPAIVMPARLIGSGAFARAISSSVMICSISPPPRPPHSRGQLTPT